MISITTNARTVIMRLSEKTVGINTDALLRSVVMAVMPEMKRRVHVEGKDAEGNRIGTYSAAYMKVRTGKFGNSAIYVRGAHKGETKNAGSYDRGGHKGLPRPMYNRTDDTKVILSLTRQMENDMSIMPNGKDYAIGYQNRHNLDKARWCEETYKKAILSQLAAAEMSLVKETAENFTNDYLK